jgi:tRNA-specific 2-thiouridylase
MRKNAKRVCVALSGGIDSSFCAWRLKEEGYSLVAVTLHTPFFPEENVHRAEELCKKLYIPHYKFNITDEFQTHVINYLLNSYLEGLTPNPCAVCNREIKFSLLVKKSEELKCDYLATGHYVHLAQEDDHYYLERAKDKRKSQEYFLALVKKNTFKKVIFPLGDFTKEEVKARMNFSGFLCGQIPESQEICFVKSRKYNRFIEQRIENPSRYHGVIMHTNGTVLGRHKGIYGYTYGQRTGLGVPWKEPLYVVDIDPHTHRIVVGEKKYLFKEDFVVNALNWFYKPGEYNNLSVKVRYNSKYIPCTIKLHSRNTLTCYFKGEKECPAPGQVAVFYQGDRVVCAGIISKDTHK